jgi:helicase SWR1
MSFLTGLRVRVLPTSEIGLKFNRLSEPIEQAIEEGTHLDEDNRQVVAKLHTVLRPYLLRRLKRDVEKELPSKYEHLVMCPLSKRQRFLYDEFMSRAQTRNDLSSGVYQKIANVLMQLRKVCNHPDLFEVRPIVTSFAMDRSAIADFEIKELLVRRRLLRDEPADKVNLDLLNLDFSWFQNTSLVAASSIRSLDGTSQLPLVTELPSEPPPYDLRTITGFKKFWQYENRVAAAARQAHVRYLNRLRCNRIPIINSELIATVSQMCSAFLPASTLDRRHGHLDTVNAIHRAIKTHGERASDMIPIIDRFSFVTPAVVALDLPRLTLADAHESISALASDTNFDAVLHRPSVKLQIAFPDPSLLQFDCGKLQRLAELLRERKLGGHRVLIFTQMTRILDILEQFLNFHGYLYLRLDGGTKIEDRQYITERFNSDTRVFCFIASSRSGGVGIKYAFAAFLRNCC